MRTKTLRLGNKLFSTAMAVIMAVVLSAFVGITPAFAAEIDEARINSEDLAAHQAIVEMVSQGAKDGFVLVSKFTDQEPDDVISTTMIYVKQEVAPYSTESGKNSVEVEKVFTVSGTPWIRMIVGGDFSWDGETCKVSGAYGSANTVNDPTSIRITKNPNYTSDSDCGSNILLGNKYAYVEKLATATNNMSTHNFRLWLDVNRKGKINTDPTKVDRITVT